ncbi:MAG: hypothetical protein ACYDH2_07055 [Anaerolineaceae bacterium]
MHSVDIAKKDKYLHVSHEGVVTSESLRGVISNTIQAVVYHNCYTVLIDYRKAILQVSSFNMVEVHGQWLAEAQAIGLEFFTIKKAYILGVHAGTKSNLRFLETYSQNRGQSVRIFTCEIEAVAWLNTFSPRRPIVVEPLNQTTEKHILRPVQPGGIPFVLTESVTTNQLV